MIDWLGARRPLEIMLLMTAALAVLLAAVDGLVNAAS